MDSEAIQCYWLFVHHKDSAICLRTLTVWIPVTVWFLYKSNLLVSLFKIHINYLGHILALKMEITPLPSMYDDANKTNPAFYTYKALP